jgi:hypothetical protein
MALLLGKVGEGLVEPEELVPGSFGSGDDVLHGLEILGPLDPGATVRGALPREAHVVRHLEEPGLGQLGLEPVPEAPAGVQIGRLDGILRLFGRAELAQAVEVDSAVVLVEEIFGELRRRGHLPSLEEAPVRVVPRMGYNRGL